MRTTTVITTTTAANHLMAYRELWADMLARSHSPEDWFQGAGDDDRHDHRDRIDRPCAGETIDREQPQATARMPYRGNASPPRRTGVNGYVRPGIRPV